MRRALLVIALLLTACNRPHTSRPFEAVNVMAVAPVLAVPTTTSTTSTTVGKFLTEHRSPPRAARTGNLVSSFSIVGVGACGGDLPPCWVMRRESGGNPRAVNPRGCGGRGCGGKWQFDPWTWRGSRRPGATWRGYAFAQDAPESDQDDRARQLWAGGAGCHHWGAC